MFKILSIILLLVVVILFLGSKKTHTADLVSNDLSISFESLVAASEAFESKYASFPTQENLIRNYAISSEQKNEVAEMARGVRPLIHADLVPLIHAFLSHKKITGSVFEKKLYSNMTLEEFVDRLLRKRPIMFMTQMDAYLLRNGERGNGGFEAIGKNKQKKPFFLLSL